MNCKQGDLAVIVRSPSGRFDGRIVTCIRFIPYGTFRRANGDLDVLHDVWETDIPNQGWGRPDSNLCVLDAHLRPIRDNDGEDETLTWAGKPNTIDQPIKENA